MVYMNRIFSRFFVTGIILNSFFFCLYLLLVGHIGPYLTISITYPLGIVTSYLANRSWVFGSNSKGRLGEIVRYLLTYLSGYLVNLIIIYILFDRMSVSYSFAQLAAVGFLVIYLFLMLRYFVFTPWRASSPRGNISQVLK